MFRAFVARPMWVMSPPNEAMTLCRLVVAFGALRSANSYATELRCRSFAVGDVIMRKAAVRSDDTYLRLTDATGAVVACGSVVDAGATLTATLYQNDAALEFESHDMEYLIDARSGAAFVGGVCGGFENIASRSRNAPATFVVPAAGTLTYSDYLRVEAPFIAFYFMDIFCR